MDFTEKSFKEINIDLIIHNILFITNGIKETAITPLWQHIHIH